ARDLGLDEELLERVGAALLVDAPFGRAALQRLDGAQLRRIRRKAALGERGFVGRLDGHAQRGPGDQKFSVRLSTASAASFVLSLSDGCAWQMRAMSSLLALNSIAITASATSSDAIGPMMCTPRISSVLASATILTKPVVSPSARARPLARKGNWPALYSRPSALSCCSFLPTQEISGEV